MKKINELIFNIGLLLAIPLLSTIYVALNNDNRGVYTVATDIDKAIPFIPAFIIPYVFWYIFIFLCFVYILIKNKKIYYRTLLSYCIGMIVCFVFYYFFQTTTPRPEFIGEGMFSRLVSKIYSNDNPYNCFPSIHCLSSYLIFVGVTKLNNHPKWMNWIVGAISFTIIVSTLFVKQHVILDALSAIILGDVIFKIVNSFKGERLLSWIEKQYLSLMMKKKLEI